MNWIKPTVCILRKKHSEPLGVNKVFHLKCCVVKQESETVNQPFCFWVMLKKQKKSLNCWNTCLRIQGFNREIVQSVWKKVFNTWIQRNIFAFILRSLKMQCALQTFQDPTASKSCCSNIFNDKNLLVCFTLINVPYKHAKVYQLS